MGRIKKMVAEVSTTIPHGKYKNCDVCGKDIDRHYYVQFWDSPEKAYIVNICISCRLESVRKTEKHYYIIGSRIKEVIGCTFGEEGKEDVLAEEPGCTFVEVDVRECCICNNKEEI